jgi:hypothetical protein
LEEERKFQMHVMNYNFEKMRDKELKEQKQIEILKEFYQREKKKD